MTIPKSKLDLYNELMEPEDINELASLTGLGRSSIYNIFKTGKCKLTAFEHFKTFYDARKIRLKEILR